jgi:protein O-mannosyl-transferase
MSLKLCVTLVGALTVAYASYFCLRHIASAYSSNLTLSGWPVGIALFKYIDWMFLPFRMSVERSTDMPADRFSTLAFAGLAGFLGLIALMFRLRKSLPIVASGMARAIIGLVPFCGVGVIYQGMAERYQYLASPGLCMSISAVMFRVQHQARRAALFGLVSVWVLWSAWRLHSRAMDWTDEGRLYSWHSSSLG